MSKAKVTEHRLEAHGIEICITKSAGDDGAVVVFIDTPNWEPTGENGPGLRVLVNDGPVFEGVKFESDGLDDE